MDTQDSPILTALEQLLHPEIVHFGFLDIAQYFAGMLRKHKNSESFDKKAFLNFVIQQLNSSRQDAERFFSDDLGKNKAISVEEKNRWLEAHNKFVDQVFLLIEKVINGTDTKVDIARLQARRDNLIEQSNQHQWARLNKAELDIQVGIRSTQTAQYKQQPQRGTIRERSLEVHKLICKQENIAIFRDRIRAFCKRYRKMEEEWRLYREQTQLERQGEVYPGVARAKKPDFNPWESLRIKLSNDNKLLAHSCVVHEFKEEDKSSDPVLDALAPYVRLAILHRKFHKHPVINNGIWSDEDSWAVSFQEQLTNRPEITTQIDADLTTVKVEIVQNTKIANQNEANILRKIADNLSIWQESGPGDKEDPRGWCTENLPKKGRETALAALRLLVDNEKLLNTCASDYGAHNSDCNQALAYLNNNILAGIRINHVHIENFVGSGDSIALPGFISELRRWARLLWEDELSGKEQPWDERNPDYMGITEAVKEAKKQGRKISVPTLSRRLTPEGPMRYMRKHTEKGKPSRCKVHIGDFKVYLKTLPLSEDQFSEEAFKKRQTDISYEKQTQGQLPDQDDGYKRLAKKILKP